MNSYDECKAIVELDLDPIKIKLMHKESGENWSLHRANAVETEYRRFLYLSKTYPDECISPTADVDTFWHYHILDTMKYAQDCEQVFGYFLHHFPYLGMRGEGDLLAQQETDARTRALYQRTFANSDTGKDSADSGTAAWCSVTAKAAWCSVTAKPAWCSVGAKAAWCSVAAKGAGCSVTVKPAWCSVATKPAWCSVASQAARAISGKPAWCSVNARSWCSVNTHKAWCSVTRKPDISTTRPRLEEEALAA